AALTNIPLYGIIQEDFAAVMQAIERDFPGKTDDLRGGLDFHRGKASEEFLKLTREYASKKKIVDEINDFVRNLEQMAQESIFDQTQIEEAGFWKQRIDAYRHSGIDGVEEARALAKSLYDKISKTFNTQKEQAEVAPAEVAPQTQPPVETPIAVHASAHDAATQAVSEPELNPEEKYRRELESLWESYAEPIREASNFYMISAKDESARESVKKLLRDIFGFPADEPDPLFSALSQFSERRDAILDKLKAEIVEAAKVVNKLKLQFVEMELNFLTGVDEKAGDDKIKPHVVPGILSEAIDGDQEDSRIKILEKLKDTLYKEQLRLTGRVTARVPLKEIAEKIKEREGEKMKEEAAAIQLQEAPLAQQPQEQSAAPQPEPEMVVEPAQTTVESIEPVVPSVEPAIPQDIPQPPLSEKPLTESGWKRMFKIASSAVTSWVGGKFPVPAVEKKSEKVEPVELQGEVFGLSLPKESRAANNEVNQDSFFPKNPEYPKNTEIILVPEHAFIGVADGMSKPPGGDEASKLLVTAMETSISKKEFDDAKTPEEIVALLERVINQGERDIVNYGLAKAAPEDDEVAIGDSPKDIAESIPGTTLATAVLWRNKAIILTVGDSFATLVRANPKPEQKQIERFGGLDSMIAQIAKAKKMTLKQASDYAPSQRSTITNKIGEKERAESVNNKFKAIKDHNYFIVDVEPGDVLIVSSDGIENIEESAPEKQAEVVKHVKAGNIQELINHLIQSPGIDDDRTAVALKVSLPAAAEAVKTTPAPSRTPRKKIAEKPWREMTLHEKTAAWEQMTLEEQIALWNQDQMTPEDRIRTWEKGFRDLLPVIGNEIILIQKNARKTAEVPAIEDILKNSNFKNKFSGNPDVLRRIEETSRRWSAVKRFAKPGDPLMTSYLDAFNEINAEIQRMKVVITPMPARRATQPHIDLGQAPQPIPQQAEESPAEVTEADKPAAEPVAEEVPAAAEPVATEPTEEELLGTFETGETASSVETEAPVETASAQDAPQTEPQIRAELERLNNFIKE
ncbi:MAG TPA: protein phosphatase 2C domain-containing protein, partial [bacterium]|nr:protein phosphatase 2C domain-containing protein [bacterium]